MRVQATPCLSLELRLEFWVANRVTGSEHEIEWAAAGMGERYDDRLELV
jgi:hypothetical protein